MQPNRNKRPRPPLDPARLRALALRYVGRYATTRARLTAYLERKILERGWREGDAADVETLVAQFVEAGYIDDDAFAAARRASLTRRGYGPRRVAADLRGYGVAANSSTDAQEAFDAAMIFARRKRIGPFAAQPADRAVKARQIAAFIRAGHGFDLARKIVDADPDTVLELPD